MLQIYVNYASIQSPNVTVVVVILGWHARSLSWWVLQFNMYSSCVSLWYTCVNPNFAASCCIKSVTELHCVQSFVRRNTASRNTICHALWFYHHVSDRDMDVFSSTSV